MGSFKSLVSFNVIRRNDWQRQRYLAGSVLQRHLDRLLVVDGGDALLLVQCLGVLRVQLPEDAPDVAAGPDQHSGCSSLPSLRSGKQSGVFGDILTLFIVTFPDLST